jgi:CHAT domain-containing protein
VAGLKLNADWVILSACNTAASDGKPGADGFSGLTKAFFYAGSQTLLVSHWAVDSAATVALTARMFTEAQKGVGRAEALRRSMLAMIDHPTDAVMRHPAMWAPFVIVGEGVARHDAR